MGKRLLKLDLSGKTALITGGARGIGLAISKALADCGAELAINYHTSQAAARKLLEEFRAAGLKAVAVQADVCEPEQVERMVDQAQQALGSIDILVNNAGGQVKLSSIEDMPLELWNKSLALNLTSAMLAARHVIPGMKAQGWGRIINISSVSARSGGGSGGAYYASAKAALSALTKGLAKELGPANITVNTIAPGVILTDLHRNFSTPEALEKIRQMTPVGRLGETEDIAGAVLFLVSDSAGYITGAAIDINGGYRMD